MPAPRALGLLSQPHKELCHPKSRFPGISQDAEPAQIPGSLSGLAHTCQCHHVPLLAALGTLGSAPSSGVGHLCRTELKSSKSLLWETQLCSRACVHKEYFSLKCHFSPFAMMGWSRCWVHALGSPVLPPLLSPSHSPIPALPSNGIRHKPGKCGGLSRPVSWARTPSQRAAAPWSIPGRAGSGLEVEQPGRESGNGCRREAHARRGGSRSFNEGFIPVISEQITRPRLRGTGWAGPAGAGTRLNQERARSGFGPWEPRLAGQGRESARSRE